MTHVAVRPADDEEHLVVEVDGLVLDLQAARRHVERLQRAVCLASLRRPCTCDGVEEHERDCARVAVLEVPETNDTLHWPTEQEARRAFSAELSDELQEGGRLSVVYDGEGDDDAIVGVLEESIGPTIVTRGWRGRDVDSPMQRVWLASPLAARVAVEALQRWLAEQADEPAPAVQAPALAGLAQGAGGLLAQAADLLAEAREALMADGDPDLLARASSARRTAEGAIKALSWAEYGLGGPR